MMFNRLIGELLPSEYMSSSASYRPTTLKIPTEREPKKTSNSVLVDIKVIAVIAGLLIS